MGKQWCMGVKWGMQPDGFAADLGRDRRGLTPKQSEASAAGGDFGRGICTQTSGGHTSVVRCRWRQPLRIRMVRQKRLMKCLGGEPASGSAGGQS